jgi:protein-disulfide isomerase
MFGLVATWTVGVSAYVFRLERSRTTGETRPAAVYVPNWRGLRNVGFATGPRDANKSVIVFSDFQCPFCRSFAAVVDSLHDEHPDILIVERHLPLVDLHEAARDAALAAECAADVGRYAEMRAVLFQRRQLVAEEEWGRLASIAGVRDTAGLVSCVSLRKHFDRIAADLAVAKGLGIDGTPGVVVNDSLFKGSMSLATLEDRLGVASASKSASVRQIAR